MGEKRGRRGPWGWGILKDLILKGKGWGVGGGGWGYESLCSQGQGGIYVDEYI